MRSVRIKAEEITTPRGWVYDSLRCSIIYIRAFTELVTAASGYIVVTLIKLTQVRLIYITFINKTSIVLCWIQYNAFNVLIVLVFTLLSDAHVCLFHAPVATVTICSCGFTYLEPFNYCYLRVNLYLCLKLIRVT